MIKKKKARMAKLIDVDGDQMFIGDPMFPPSEQRFPKTKKVTIHAYETTTEFRILVCGSRDWADEAPVRRELLRLIAESKHPRNEVLVITGSTWEEDNGVDSIVEQLCRVELGIACAIFRAPWKFMERQNNKRAAGPMRNGWMLKWGRPDHVLAFHPYIVNSRGTKHMCNEARKAGVPVRVIEK